MDHTISKLQAHIVYLEALLTQHKIPFNNLNAHQIIEKAPNPNFNPPPLASNLTSPENAVQDALTKNEIERYSRQMILREVSLRGQQLLKQSRVLVVGAGGIGAPALLYLAGSGVGTIGVIDHDAVETSNLHRQIIHCEARVGLNKALSAKIALEAFNSSVKVIAHAERLQPANISAILPNYDLVIDASDNPKTRYLVNDACILLKKILVSGSAIGWEGQLTVYGGTRQNALAPCYRCLYAECPRGNSVRSCSESGVVGAVPGVIGLLAALEALKIIVDGKAEILSGQLLLFDGLRARFKTVRLRQKQDSCILPCGKSPSLRDVQDLLQYDYEAFVNGEAQKPLVCEMKTLVQQPASSVREISWQQFIDEGLPSDKQASFLDVRAETISEIVNLRTFKRIPLEKLRQMNEEQLQQQIAETKDKKIYVMCRLGISSRRGCEFLQERGYLNVFSIKGGIQEYARNFDATLPFI